MPQQKARAGGLFVGGNAVSFELEIGGLDDFRPLLDFAFQPVAELLGCHGVDLGALLGEVFLHLRRVEDARDLGVEPADGFFRRRPGASGGDRRRGADDAQDSASHFQ